MSVCCCCRWSRRLRRQICLTSSPSPVTSTSPACYRAASTARPTPTPPSRTSSGPRMIVRWSSTERRAPPATDAWGCRGTGRWCFDRPPPPTRACTPARRTHGSARDNRRRHCISTSKVSARSLLSAVYNSLLIVLLNLLNYGAYNQT